jgi:hypothetical protein
MGVVSTSCRRGQAGLEERIATSGTVSTCTWPHEPAATNGGRNDLFSDSSALSGANRTDVTGLLDELGGGDRAALDELFRLAARFLRLSGEEIARHHGR